MGFSVAKAETTIRASHTPQGSPPRVGEGAPVYLAAIMEYLSAEVLELAGNSARDAGRTKIQVCDVYNCIECDNELLAMVYGTEFRRGLLPRLHPELAADEPSCIAEEEEEEQSDKEEEDDEENEGEFSFERDKDIEVSDSESSDEESKEKEESGWYTEADLEADQEDEESEGYVGSDSDVEDDVEVFNEQDAQRLEHERERTARGVVVVLDQSLNPSRLCGLDRRVYKVLKQVHPDTGIRTDAMRLVVQIIQHAGDTISAKGVALAQHGKTSGNHVVTPREIQTAVRLHLPGELAKHAVSEGTKAVTKHISSSTVWQIANAT